MKPLLVSITALVFALSNISLEKDMVSDIYNCDFNVTQDDNYYDQNLHFKSEDLFYIDCVSCHGGKGEGGNKVQLAENFDPNLVVHQENHPQFLENLQTFLETHDDDEAAEKYVDHQKVVDFVSQF